MKKKLMALLMCATLSLQPVSIAQAEDLLSSGEMTIESPIELDDGIETGLDEEANESDSSKEPETPKEENETIPLETEESDTLENHQYEKNIVKASFTKNGVISETCKLCGSKKEDVTINKVSDIMLSNTKYEYNGSNRRPKVTLKDSTGEILSKEFYAVKYPEESKKTGTYTLTITLKGAYYEGTATREYTVVKANQKIKLEDVTKRIDSKTVTLKAQITQGNKSGRFGYKSDNPEVASVTSWGKVTFHKVGKARITATTNENANYNSASKTITVTVIPKPTAITKLLYPKKSWLNIQYRANPDADGYQIQYGTSPDMRGAQYVAVNNNAIRSYTRKDARDGSMYYVRVRTFNVVNGERIYSNWSGVKNILAEIIPSKPTKPTGPFGTVSGNVTWHYNRYIGYVADASAKVFLIPTDGSAKSYVSDDELGLMFLVDETQEELREYNIYSTKVDGSGNYTINRVPEGRYKVLIISANSKSGGWFEAEDTNKYFASIAPEFTSYLNSRTALNLAKSISFYRYTTKMITVYGNDDTTCSHAFTYTYI